MRTLAKADLVEHLMAELKLTRQEARSIVDQFFTQLSETLISGTEVKLSGFGNFELKDKSPRPGRNPKTGEAVMIEARRVVTFKAGQKLRQLIDQRLLQQSSESA